MLVVGAGLSGVDAGYHLMKRCPTLSFAIVEAGDAMGGTWRLFRYPGIRSDSDPQTLGFPFRPWTEPVSVADGEAIRIYIEETAREFGIDRHIRLGHRVTVAAWSTADARWTVTLETPAGQRQITCGFLFMCAGYFDYDAGYAPDFPGKSDYRGVWVHPQHWPDNLDHAGKRVAVIGSGATAVTVVPALARTAARVTMIQRSPSYVVARPSVDKFAARAFRLLPPGQAAGLVRWRNVLIGSLTFWASRRYPALVRRAILKAVVRELPEPGADRHFTPSYAPWDQRVCLAPDGDLFAAIRSGRVEVVTDTIDRVTPDGLRLGSGREIAADIVVSATGLAVRLMGGIALTVDGLPADPAGRMVYKGMMLSGMPNFAFALGYTNASWTLKCDLVSRYVCRLLNRMRERGWTACMPVQPAPDIEPRPLIDFSSGYIKRAEGRVPHQGSRAPWQLRQNYALDLAMVRFGRLEDGVMRFT